MKDVTRPMRKLKTHEEEIDPRKIVLPGFSPRDRVDEQHVAGIAESFLKDGGQISKALVTYRDNRPVIVDGCHEVRAAIEAGLKKVNAIVYDDISDEEAAILPIRLHFLRKNFEDLDVAKVLRKMRDQGWSVQQIVEQMPEKFRNQMHVYQLLKLLDLHPSIQEEIRHPGTLVKDPKGRILFTHAQAIATLETPEQQLSVAKEVLRHGLSVTDTQEFVKLTRETADAGVTDEDIKIIHEAVKQGKTIQQFGKIVTEKAREGTLVNAAKLSFWRLLVDVAPKLSQYHSLVLPRDACVTALRIDLARLDSR